ncbi:septum formation inhibitor Maf [Ferrimonas sediminicola]|uniref:dTTP/UTP pyrophosphatase n=1 Tax=Ferrimonas sediminicola TaxID=2569538 RepID=A0A4U1BK72_9GAMM|nr:septum formation inhibitor Maf [Ferrimonas sediminicola]
MPNCFLASSSPRRRELLGQLGCQFDCVSPEIDETPGDRESPTDYVARLAREKAWAGEALTDGSRPVLGSDTVVVLDGRILGKPRDQADAEATLAALRGRSHQVMTAVAVVWRERLEQALVVTEVTFGAMTAEQIRDYVAGGEPMDKAGSYGIQGEGGAFVKAINGSYSAVVGLPLVETRELLSRF